MLSKADCEIVWCEHGEQAIRLLQNTRIDVAIISVSPETSSRMLFDQISRAAGAIPILVATHADEIEERIHGLNHGAADYLIRPYGAAELLARIATILRRRENLQDRFTRRGKVLLDKEIGRLGDGSTWTILSRTEHKVFSLLLGSEGRPVSKERLKTALADDGCITDNAVEVGIYRLRIKARPWGMRIKTYRGLGYLLEEAA